MKVELSALKFDLQDHKTASSKVSLVHKAGQDQSTYIVDDTSFNISEPITISDPDGFWEKLHLSSDASLSPKDLLLKIVTDNPTIPLQHLYKIFPKMALRPKLPNVANSTCELKVLNKRWYDFEHSPSAKVALLQPVMTTPLIHGEKNININHDSNVFKLENENFVSEIFHATIEAYKNVAGNGYVCEDEFSFSELRYSRDSEGGLVATWPATAVVEAAQSQHDTNVFAAKGVIASITATLNTLQAKCSGNEEAMAEFMEFKKDIEDIFQINNGTSKTEAAYVNCNITNAEIFCAKAATFLHNVVLKSTEPLDEQTIALNDQDFVIDVSNTASIDPIANKLYQIALHSQGANIDEQYTTVRIASDSDFNLLNFGLNEMHFYKNNEGKIFFTVPSNSTDADLVYEVDSNMLIENMTFENFVKTSIKHIDHTAEINLHNDEEKLTANANEFIKGYTVAKEDNIEISKYEYNAYTFTEQFEDDFDELPVFVSPSSGAGEQIQIDINNNGHHTYVVNYKGSYIPYDDVAAQTIHFSKPTNPTEVNNYRENIKNRFGQHANFLQDFAIINEVYLGLGFSEEKQNELMLSKSLDSAKKLSFFNTSLYLNDNKIRTFDECGRIVTYELNTIGSGYTKYVRDQNNKIMYKQRFNSNGKTKDLSPSEKQIETMDLLERYNDISKQLEKFGSELLNVDVLLSEQSINSYIDASTNDIGVLTKQLAFIKSKLSETMPEAHVELALKLIKERDANKQNATNKKDLGNIDSHFKDDMEKAVMKNGKIVSSNTASDIYATKLTESITKNETIESAKKFLQLQARVASQFDAKNFGNEKEYADALNAALNKEIQKATNNFIILISKNINLNSENIEGKEKENVILGNALSLANGLVKCANSEFKAEDVKTLKILVGKISKIDEKSKMKKIQPDYDSPYESSKKIKTKLMKKLNADQKGKDVATKDDKTATVNQKSESHDIQIQTQKLTDN